MSTKRIEAPYRTEVAPNVHAYVQPDGGWFLNNAGFVVGNDQVILIDQLGSEARGRALVAEVERSAPGCALSTVVNTHHHADHTFGNWVLPASTSVVATASARRLMAETGIDVSKLEHLRNPVTGEPPNWGELHLRLPDITVEDPVSLWLGATEVQLIPIPTPAHTMGDLVVWIPDQQVLFAGDLVFAGGMPLAAQGSIAGWLEALDAVSGLAPATVVPGHGPVTDANALEEMADYFRWLQSVAEEGYASGVPPLEFARHTDLGPYGEWTDTERIVPNLHRAYSELQGKPRGSPLPSRYMVEQMVEYHGGPLPCHC